MYFGSVKFFRHLIIAVLMLLIVIPVIFAVNYGIKYKETNNKLTEVQNIVSQYNKTDKNELVNNLTTLLDSSFDTQIPAFQQKVDDSVEEQLNTLQTQMNETITTQMGALQTTIDTSLSNNTSEINDNQSTLQQQLSGIIKTQTASVQKQLEKKLDEKTTEMIVQFNESLSDQITLLQQYIDTLNVTEPGNG